MSVRSILTIALAIAALAAPTASARPAEDPPAATQATTAVQHYPTRPAQGSQANPRPEVTASTRTDSGIAWTTIAIALAAALLACGAIAGVTVRTRQGARSRITA